MTSYNTDGKVGLWAEEKLLCLSKYLHAYTTIMRRQSWCKGYFYIDAFAGAGIAPLRQQSAEADDHGFLASLSDWSGDQEVSEYVLGSPHRALSIKHPFSQYLFVDADESRCARLEEIKAEFSGTRSIQIIQGDANDVIVNRVIKNQHIDWKSYRAVVFLDPFGMQVPWQTLRALAETKAIEVVINFPVGMAIQRLLQRDGKLPPARRTLLNSYFGTGEWESIVYNVQEDMFGDTTKSKVTNSGDKLASWYRARLQTEFGYAAPARLIRNSKGTPLYYLMFAGPKAKGAEIAEDILRQGEAID